MVGSLFGGIVYARLARTILRNRSCQVEENELTVQGKFGIPTFLAICAYEVLCLGMLGLLAFFTTEKSPVSLHPMLGGSLIGMAQAATLILTDSPIGVSTAYETIGQLFWRLLRFKSQHKGAAMPPIPLRSVYFANGIILGALITTRLATPMASMVFNEFSTFRSVAGGFVLVVGARIAGGCTSGHGISGMSMLGLSSIITVVSMFAGGFGSALLI